MLGVVNSERWGLSDLRVWGLAGFGVMLFPVLIRRSRVHPEPLINLELFQHRSFASVNFSVVFYGLAFTAGALVNSLVLQDLWGQSISTTGLAMAPGPLVGAMVSPVSGAVADKFGHRWVLGLGLTVATWTSAGLSDVPPAKFGVAGATFNAIRQMTYALGISMAITLVAVGDSPLDVMGYRWAWSFICVCYVLCAVAVVTTFPPGGPRTQHVWHRLALAKLSLRVRSVLWVGTNRDRCPYPWPPLRR